MYLPPHASGLLSGFPSPSSPSCCTRRNAWILHAHFGLISCVVCMKCVRSIFRPRYRSPLHYSGMSSARIIILSSAFALWTTRPLKVLELNKRHVVTDCRGWGAHLFLQKPQTEQSFRASRGCGIVSWHIARFIKNSLRVKAEVIKAEMVVCKIFPFIINM